VKLPKIFLEGAKTESRPAILTVGFFQPTPNKEDKESKEKKGKKESSTAAVQPIYKGKKTKESDALLNLLRESKHFGAKKNETSFFRFYPYGKYSGVALIGLGTLKAWNPEIARQAGAATLLLQKKEKVPHFALQAEAFFSEAKGSDSFLFLQAFCEGYLLAGYRYYDLLKEKKSDEEPELSLELVGVKGASQQKAVDRANAFAEAVNFARHLGDRPSNLLTPTEFANLVSQMCKEKGLKCTVLGKKEIEQQKMGLFLGVAQASAQEPKFLVMENAGGKKDDKPIVLIGKGITFDTGGISLKPADRMEDMKYDMMGAAAVAGTFHALGSLKVPRRIIGLIPLTENMPGGRAQKPGDVQRSMSGKTVEITNTDAEGRLVLADAIEYAQKEYEPQAILDFATLTGAVVVALGSVTTGIMGNSPSLIEQIRASSVETGEKVWELPLYDEYEDDMKSSFADYRNSGTREAGSSKAGTFLKFFVDKEIPWVHFDIAGAAYHRKDVNYHPHKFGAGVMVRLVTHLLEGWKTPKR
jgi:leucyl aminopeptidase